MYNQLDLLGSKLFSLSQSDVNLIHELTVPVPSNEQERIKVLREANILDSDTDDTGFDRFTSLCRRIFQVGLRA